MKIYSITGNVVSSYYIVAAHTKIEARLLINQDWARSALVEEVGTYTGDYHEAVILSGQPIFNLN